MRKFLTLIGAILLCLPFTSKADVYGTGSWSATLATWSGGDKVISGQSINGRFSGNQLIVSDIQTTDATNTAGNEKFEPLTLTVDLATGEARGENQLAFEYPGYAAYDGYYCDNDKIGGKPWVITGKFVNIGNGQSKLILSEWCTKYNNTAGRGGPGTWKNSVAIFEFEVEGLITESGSTDPDPVDPDPVDPDPDKKVNYMTANYYKSDGTLMTYENVTGEYNAANRTLTLKNVANKYSYPLVLDVDNEGKLVSKPNQISLYEDGLELYYSDSEKQDNTVYGKIENGDGIATIRLNDWGDYIPDWGMFYSQWFNTVIVLDHTIDFVGGTVDPDPDPVDPDPVDPDPDPEPGDYIKCVLTSVEYQNGTLKFSDDNVLGVGTGLAPNGNASYGAYFKLRWTPNINQYGTNKDGVYYYILPANIDPDTKEITLRTIDMNNAKDNHIKFDFSNGSYKVYEGLYNAESNDDPGSSIENSCIVIASYYDNGMKDFKRIERAFYLKGGEFLGDTDGNMPSVSQFGSITFEANKQYQWELLLDEIDLSPAPVQGETITGLFTAKKTGDNPFEFSADNPFGIKFRLKETRIASYGNYWKLRWTIDSQYDSNPKDGLYYYLLPATINPDTKEITLNEMDAFANHIGYDYTNTSKAVYEGLYKATSHTDNGAPMENSCVVIASYHKSGMTDFNKIERAFYLKGGVFKGDTNGVMPGLTVKYGSDYIDYKDGVEYQWELTFEEIPLGEAEESDYAKGTGTFKSLYTQTGGSKDELRTATVDGVYNNGKLRVDKLPTSIPESRTYCQEITFSVDLENGTVTATDQVVNALLVGASYENLYFATYPDMSKTVTGSFVNIGDGKCQLTLDDWCEMYSNTTINGIYWAKTKIVFNFEVKGLKMGTEVDDPSVSYVPTVNYMYANVGSEAGEYKLYEPVKGEYNETAKTITLTGVAGKAENCPLTLNVVDNEGTLESKGNESSDHSWEPEAYIYYSDLNKADTKVYGNVANNTDGTCTITLDAWGDYVPEWGEFLPNQTWYNTIIVLDLSIPGLPNYKEDNGDDPDPGVQGGIVEGEWQFNVEDLYNHTTSTEKWTATLIDGMLHFSGNDNFADFYAEYYSDGTVLIPGEEMFVGIGGSRNYDLRQIGFSNYSLVDQSYDAKDITGQYDASKGTMTFTTSPREGILWRAYLDGELAGGYDMLAFVKGTQLSKSESEPALVLNVEEITCNPTDFFADVIIPIHTTGLPMDTPITLTYSLDEGEAKTKEVNAGNNMLSFMGLKPGTEYELHLMAESGELKGEDVTYTFKTTGEPQTSGIETVDTDNDDVRYFNLQGIEIFDPTPGTICIKVTGKKAERIVVR